MENNETKYTTAEKANEDLQKNAEPKILREVKYWNNEAVITKLSAEDRDQLFFRQGNLISEFLRNVLITGVDIQLILTAIAERQGIDVDYVLNKTPIKNTSDNAQKEINSVTQQGVQISKKEPVETKKQTKTTKKTK